MREITRMVGPLRVERLTLELPHEALEGPASLGTHWMCVQYGRKSGNTFLTR